MQALLRISLVIFTLFSLSGCMVSSKENIKKMTDGNKILIVSILPEKYQVKQIGVWAFGNESKELDVSHWGINKKVSESVLKALSKTRFEGVWAEDYVSNLQYDIRDNKLFPQAEVNKLQNFAKSKGISTILIVEHAGNNDPYYHTNQHINAYGHVQRLGFDNNANSKKYSRVSVNFYDVNDMSLNAYGFGNESTKNKVIKVSGGLSSVTSQTVEDDKEVIIELTTQAVLEALISLDIQGIKLIRKIKQDD